VYLIGPGAPQNCNEQTGICHTAHSEKTGRKIFRGHEKLCDRRTCALLVNLLVAAARALKMVLADAGLNPFEMMEGLIFDVAKPRDKHTSRSYVMCVGGDDYVVIYAAGSQGVRVSLSDAGRTVNLEFVNEHTASTDPTADVARSATRAVLAELDNHTIELNRVPYKVLFVSSDYVTPPRIHPIAHGILPATKR
jgi:hypothetical protein